MTCVPGATSSSDRTGVEEDVVRQITSAPSIVPASAPSRAAAPGSRATAGRTRTTARAAASAGAPAPAPLSRRSRAPKHFARERARGQRRGRRRPQPGDLLAVHQRQAGAGRRVEQGDHRGMRLEPQRDVAGEHPDELHGDRALHLPSGHREKGPAVGRNRLARRRGERAGGKRLEAGGKRVEERRRRQQFLDLGARGSARPRRLLQVQTPFADRAFVETPSFTFRLERVRTIRERAEDRAREELSNELRVRAEVRPCSSRPPTPPSPPATTAAPPCDAASLVV